MYISDALSVLEIFDPEWIQNSIVNLFHMILEGALMFPTHDIYQLESQLLFKVCAMLRSSEQI